MTVNWTDVLHRLRTYPAAAHRIRPPCPESQIEAAEQQLGKFPTPLSDMLRHFNGARLFDNCGEFVALFGISEEPPLPALEWAADWHIDKFTPKWRAAGKDRQDDWAFAMMNYGELILLDGHCTVKGWDTSQQKWTPGTCSLYQWIEGILRGGEAYLNES